jgi:5-hydroxyisourate hydrolase
MTATSPITTHALDTRLGRPAAGLAVALEYLEQSGATGNWQPLARGTTDENGRIGDLLPADPIPTGRYRITFKTAPYFTGQGVDYFYPRVTIEFEVSDPAAHYHVPLVFSPFGYSTYRGS